MKSTSRAGVVTGVVTATSLAAVSIVFALRRRRRRQRGGPAQRSCGAGRLGADKDVSSRSALDSDARDTAPGLLASLVSGFSQVRPVEPWHGRGVMRALGVKAPEESIVDVMATFYERVLGDDETKDVEIEMSNGTIQAHSVVLCASSDAIKGILRHSGGDGRPKKLSWREHPVEVGNFLLRLLYTGTVDEGDFAENEASDTNSSEQDVPLYIILGSFEIGMVYLITHLLPTLVQAVQRRLEVDTFNSICTAAIKVDAMALRLYCLQYARSNPRKLRYEDLRCGMRVRALRQINHEHADVPEGTLGIVEWGHGDWLDIHWRCHPEYTNGLQEVLGSIEIVDHTMPGKTLRQIYNAEEFSPEVMSELAAIWGQVRSPMKRRTRRIM